MKVSANFELHEFVPRPVYERFGDKALQFLDMRMVTLAQFYRTTFGKTVMINNWANGGQFQERGFRLPSSTQGAELSQHKFGRAFDCNVYGMTVEEVYAYILANPQKFYDAGLRVLEDIKITTGWVHSDVRDTTAYGIKPGQILIVQP